MKSKEKLIQVIQNYTNPDFVDKLIDEIKPSIQLKTVGENTSPLFSKFGGLPDLPIGFDWVKYESGKHFSFLAQFNLSELNEFEPKNQLPTSGFLYFFYDFESWHSGTVYFFETIDEFYCPEAPTELLPKKKNWFQKLFNIKPFSGILKESKIELYNSFNIPSWNSIQAEKIATELNLDIRKIEVFDEEFYEKLNAGDLLKENEPDHRLLGNYSGIQNEFLQTEIISQFMDRKKVNSLPFEELLKWKLLFQFDSDRNLELNIADGGRLYFFIHEDDLKKHDFTKVRVVGDCY